MRKSLQIFLTALQFVYGTAGREHLIVYSKRRRYEYLNVMHLYSGFVCIGRWAEQARERQMCARNEAMGTSLHYRLRTLWTLLEEKMKKKWTC